MKKTSIIFIVFTILLAACKQDNPDKSDPIISSHYMFKPGTYWVYTDYNHYLDSQYVVQNGEKNGYKYMQINEVLKGLYKDTIYATNTIYIGGGPQANQLQLWGYDHLNHNDAQVIFQSDTPILGSVIANGVRFAGIDHTISIGLVPPTTIDYALSYSEGNKNQVYGNVHFYFYPDMGIVRKDEYSTPWGDLAWRLIRDHINH